VKDTAQGEIRYTPDMDRDLTDLQLMGLAATYPDLDGGVYQVTGRIARLGLYLARRQEEVFGRFGLNRAEVGVLSSLRFVGPPYRQTPTRLGRGLLMSSAGITSRIDRLERRGLIVRLPDPDDRRGVLIELTDHGRELVDAAIRANTESEREVVAGFTGRDLETFQRLLRRLVSTLEGPGAG
jgi:DNA-binding MarR family transcriptional regulator